MHLARLRQNSQWSLLSCALLSSNLLLCCNHSLPLINHTLRLFAGFFYPPNQWRVFLGYIMCSMVWFMSLDYWWDLYALLLWIKVLKVQVSSYFSQSLTIFYYDWYFHLAHPCDFWNLELQRTFEEIKSLSKN